MRTKIVRMNLSVVFVTASFIAFAVACDSGSTNATTTTNTTTPVDAGGTALPADDASHGRTLTLSLDTSIDGDSDDVKATALTSADLLDTSGHIAAAHATTNAGGSAVFDIAGVLAGDYFLKINNDGDDLVPTRLDDSVLDVAQRVGQKLRASYVGPPDDPTYRINTWSSGQAQIAAIKFSNGASLTGEQPYVIMTLTSARSTPKVEFKVLGTAAPLTTITPTAIHAGSEPFDSWILNTNGKDHHGDMFAADGGASSCSGCHWEDWRKPLGGYSALRPSQGWCFACHSGTDGSGAGFVDSAQ